jgi:cell division septum initiation protein DivIVA
MLTDAQITEFLVKEENRDILTELTDPRFDGRRHYNKSLYAEGCHGPLCRKKERDLGRAARRALAESEGRVYQPGRTPRLDDRDDLLTAVTDWHYRQLETARLLAKQAREQKKLAEKIAAQRDRVTALETRMKGLTAGLTVSTVSVSQSAIRSGTVRCKHTSVPSVTDTVDPRE